MGQEKWIFNDGSRIESLWGVWISIIACCAWNSVIASSEPIDNIWIPSWGAISWISFLCNWLIVFELSFPLFGINAIMIGGNFGKGIFNRN